jgi:hypothetical protein
VFRSNDMGESFVRLSGSESSGLPDQGVSSLVADPSNPNRFYAAAPAPLSGPTGSEGIYRSDDGGATWVAANNGLSGLDSSLRILLSIHNNISRETNAIYAAILSGGLQGVFRSDNFGASWTALGVPPEPVFPGTQTIFHGAVASDPQDPNVVFISGDFGGCGFGNNWRGDASLLPASPWTSLDCEGVSGTSPHADSRAMVFDANGNLLQANDGGLYRLVDPNNRFNQRRWLSVNGDIRPTEFFSVAYDPLSEIVFGGTQDNGTPIQSAPNEFSSVQLLGGDGGKVAVDADQTSHPGTSLRYTSFQGFGFFNRTTWNATNAMIGGFSPVQLLITSGPGTGETLFQFDHTIQFLQQFVLNTIDPSRMLIVTSSIYESFDRGDSLSNLGDNGTPFLRVGVALGSSAMAYGGRLAGMPYRDVFYIGAMGIGPTGLTVPVIFHRAALSGPITTLNSYTGNYIAGLVIDPQNYRHVLVLDSDNRV